VAVGGRISLLELIRTLQVILKTDVAPVLGPAREGDIRDSQADITKAVSFWDLRRWCRSTKACARPSSGSSRAAR
jgi:hypothetical protein